VVIAEHVPQRVGRGEARGGEDQEVAVARPVERAPAGEVGAGQFGAHVVDEPGRVGEVRGVRGDGGRAVVMDDGADPARLPGAVLVGVAAGGQARRGPPDVDRARMRKPPVVKVAGDFHADSRAVLRHRWPPVVCG
jgi:hypothetical protein